MKKIILSAAVLTTIFSSNGQQLLTEDFNSMTTGDFSTVPVTFAASIAAQNNWTIYSFTANPTNSAFQIANVAANDNRFVYTGSPLPASTVSPTENNYVQKSIGWSNRTNGNDYVLAECVFNTGASSTSKNEFIFGIYNSNRSKTISAFKYVHDTRILSGIAFDSTDASNYGNYLYSSIGVGGSSLVLLNDTDYYFRLVYDVNSGITKWYVALNSTPGTALCNSFVQNSITSDVSLLVMVAKAGTSNASSSSVSFDDILVEARPCSNFSTVANSDFSYSAGSHCIGTSNLTPVLVDNSSVGVYSSTPAGLALDASTGIIDLSNSGSAAGIYSVKFVATNACTDSTTINITILDCAGIEDITRNNFSIYPNPANDLVTITLSDLVISEGTIRFLSADGKLIESREFNNSTIESFDVKSLKSGVYFFQIGNTTEKVIIN